MHCNEEFLCTTPKVEVNCYKSMVIMILRNIALTAMSPMLVKGHVVGYVPPQARMGLEDEIVQVLP